MTLTMSIPPTSATANPVRFRKDVPMLESRVKVLRTIASRYHELVDPSGSNGLKGSGEHVPLMPSTYSPTVKEFERLLGAMKYDRTQPLIRVGSERVSVRRLRWHITEWYIAARQVQRPAMLHRAKDGGWQPLVDRDGWPVEKIPFGVAVMRDRDATPTYTQVMCYLRLPDARETLADAGLAWIAQHWATAEPVEPENGTERKPTAAVQVVDSVELVNRRTRQAMRDSRNAA